MAHWLMVVIALTCLSGLTSPSPTPMSYKKLYFQELIMELINITDNQKDNLCNDSMVWSVNLTDNEPQFCAALDSLRSVSNCSVLEKTLKSLSSFCSLTRQTGVPSTLAQHTKIELKSFLKDLLNHMRHLYSRHTSK